MPWKNDAVLKRRDVFEVDPRAIEIEAGWNPRTDFSGEDELMASIIENGVRVPLTVKAVGDRIVLVDGERRLRATRRAIAEGAGIVSVPAMLSRRGVSDVEALLDSLIKNDGKPLTATEEAEAFRRLSAWGLTQQDIARRVGKSQGYVCGRLALVDAVPEVKEALNKKEITKKDAIKVVKKSQGSVAAQREGLVKAREDRRAGAASGSGGNGFKPMRADAIEKLIGEYKGVEKAKLNDYARAFNEGIVAGLSMVLFNSPEVKKEWLSK